MKKNIVAKMQSDEVCDRIDGFLKAADSKDTSYVKFIFQDRDGRIAHCSKYLGSTVEQAKIFACEKISGIKAPHEYMSDDQENILLDLLFYQSWAFKKGYIQKENLIFSNTK